jgi:hypothetical protein
MTVLRAALTVREILGLALDCAQSCMDSPGPAPVYTVRVRKACGGHERPLQLDLETSLHAWMEVQPPALHRSSCLVEGERTGRSIALKGRCNICQAYLARCLVEQGLLAAPHPIATPSLNSIGPNTLRNTCIAGWFNADVPLQEIEQRCGFQDASVMNRLGAHLFTPLPR